MTVDAEESRACPHNHEAMQLTGGESRLDPDILNNSFPFYRALRKEAPVYFDEKLDVYLISKHDDALSVLRDDINFSLEHGYQDRWANGHAEELEAILRRDSGVFVRDPALDPPAHTRVRRLIEKAFTAHRVKSLEPRIRTIVGEVIDGLLLRGEADGRLDIGTAITARVVCDQLGFDFDEVGIDNFASWTTAWVAQMGRMQSHAEMLENAKEIIELQKYIVRKIRERETEPKEDLTSDIVHARLDDDANPTLSFEEQVAWVRALMIGGNDTTATALANLMMILATRPDIARTLHEIADDELLVTRFADEVLRIEPPAHGLYRTAVNAVEVGGTMIPEGAQVCILFASANDDDAVFAGPRDFDLDRKNSGRTLTFGAGIHRCVASALARVEVKIAAQEIIRRMDHIKLAIPEEELRYLPTLGTQTLDKVPIVFTRRAKRKSSPLRLPAKAGALDRLRPAQDGRVWG